MEVRLTFFPPLSLRQSLLTTLCVCVAALFAACSGKEGHTADAINDSDSMAVMTSYGVNALVSDSGVIKYRIVTEQWDVNTAINPPRWLFEKGVLLEQFDEKYHVESYIQCDTAYYYTSLRQWHLLGRVRIITKDGLRFSSDELIWDEGKHELSSHRYSQLITPERQLEGNYFRSDERMSTYYITNTRGSFERGDLEGKSQTPSAAGAPDVPGGFARPPMQPHAKTR